MSYSLEGGPFKIVDSSDMFRVISHQVVHDYNANGFHVLYLDGVDAVETCYQGVWILVDVIVIFFKNTFSC
jgi:hypothetical protein